ncbi:MAG: OmpH family outer membrane protein [Armatimonadetes bacterium]|nr:OmpH family outer membrane protein [Armatimonadota bacterium]
MFMSRRIAWVVIVVVALAAFSGIAAMAADTKIGVVDLAKVNSDAPRMKQYWDDFNAVKASLEAKLDIRQKNMLLSGDEVQQLVDLKIKATRTDQEILRVKELETLQDNNAKEMSDLAQTKELTDQNKARLKELQDIRKKSEDTGMALTKDYDAELKKKLSELDAKAEVDLQDAISSVAGAKGITIVVAKDAVLFGGEDITPDIIKKLDRKAQ